MDTINKIVLWGSTQLEIILFMVLFITLLVTAFRRAWIAMITTVVVLSFFAIFVSKPMVLVDLAEWLASKLSIG